MRRAFSLVVSVVVVVTACSSGDDSGGDAQPADDVAGTTVETVADTAATTAPAPGSGGGADRDPGGDAVAAELEEWEIDAPAEYAAGPVTFEVSNTGTFTHELVVIRGESYESLPLAANGSVIEDDLDEGALVGRTPRIESGGSDTLTVQLEPGSYVLLCNISSGPTSHAAQGQRLPVTVD